jgi:hypothetical protein
MLIPLESYPFNPEMLVGKKVKWVCKCPSCLGVLTGRMLTIKSLHENILRIDIGHGKEQAIVHVHETGTLLIEV